VSSSGGNGAAGDLRNHQGRARVAIDLGAESCRVSLLRWHEGTGSPRTGLGPWGCGRPEITLIHRIPNGPVHLDGSLRWPFERILAGLDEGLRKAAAAAPEGIASIAVDGWAVDYVRLGADGKPLAEPFCYRDERNIASKEVADRLAPPEWAYRHAGAWPLRINTVYQLLADPASGIGPHAPWVNLPEYVLYRLGGRRVAEYTNATHTGLVDIATGDWSEELLERLICRKLHFRRLFPPGLWLGN
jgi:rhamnulokinase